MANNPKIRVIAVNGSGGAFVLVSASIFSRYVEIQECPPADGSYAGTFQPLGLQYQRPDDSPAYSISYGLEPEDILTLGDKQYARDRAVGVPSRTDPAGNTLVATPYFKLRGATATGSQVRVSEWP